MADCTNCPVKEAVLEAIKLIREYKQENKDLEYKYIFRVYHNKDVRPADGWICVDDKLPEIDKEVLVYYQYYREKGDITKECGISKYYNRGKWSTLHIPIDSEVLYWQPLPEPPNE